MAIYFAKEFVGVRDGTVPTQMVFGGIVDAKKRATRATKDNVNTLAAGDQIYIGRMPVGAIAKRFSVVSDTSFGSTTISIGTLQNPTKYVNAKTMTVTDVPTVLGPSAAASVMAPLTTGEDVYVTLGAGGLAAAVVAAFNMEFTISA